MSDNPRYNGRDGNGYQPSAGPPPFTSTAKPVGPPNEVIIGPPSIAALLAPLMAGVAALVYLAFL